MLLFPTKDFSITTALSAEEVEKRLHENYSVTMNPFTGYKLFHRGVIGGDYFSLITSTVSIHGSSFFGRRNSFSYEVNGRITDEGDMRRIDVSVKETGFGVFGRIVAYVILCIVAIASLVATLTEGYYVALLAIPFIIIPVIYSFVFLSRNDLDLLERRMRDILEIS